MSVVLGDLTQRIESAVFLDTSFIIDSIFRAAGPHPAASELLTQLAMGRMEGRIRLCVSTRVIDELLWASRTILLERDRGVRSWGRLTAREASEAWLRYSEEIAHLGRLLLSPDAPWEVLGVTAEDAGMAVGVIETHGLQPADAFHYAVCQRACESCIITNDRHFRALPELNCIRYDVDL